MPPDGRQPRQGSVIDRSRAVPRQRLVNVPRAAVPEEVIKGAGGGRGAGLVELLDEALYGVDRDGSHLHFLLRARGDELAALDARQEGAVVSQHAIDAQDVCDGDAMRETASDFQEKCGGVDIVIANAGIGGPDRLGKGDLTSIARTIDVNVIMLKALIREMGLSSRDKVEVGISTSAGGMMRLRQGKLDGYIAPIVDDG